MAGKVTVVDAERKVGELQMLANRCGQEQELIHNPFVHVILFSL